MVLYSSICVNVMLICSYICASLGKFVRGTGCIASWGRWALNRNFIVKGLQCPMALFGRGKTVGFFPGEGDPGFYELPYSRVIRRISPISAYPLLGGGFCS